MPKVSKSKPQPSKLKNRKILVVVGSIFVLLFLLFLCRGLVRMDVLPKAVELSYGRSVNNAYKNEPAKLQDPFTLLGYKDSEKDLVSMMNGCNTVLANGIRTQIDCGYDIGFYRQIDTSSESKKGLNANAEKLQSLLKANGWQGEYSNEGQAQTSLVRLISSVTAGIDSQPDATYQKQIGSVQCFFHANTAFSKPDSPALGVQFSCSRTINVLGEPSWN